LIPVSVTGALLTILPDPQPDKNTMAAKSENLTKNLLFLYNFFFLMSVSL
jgi:hypothetical protein